MFGMSPTEIEFKDPFYMNSEERREFVYRILEKSAEAGDTETVQLCIDCIEVLERWVPVEETLGSSKITSILAKHDTKE